MNKKKDALYKTNCGHRPFKYEKAWLDHVQGCEVCSGSISGSETDIKKTVTDNSLEPDKKPDSDFDQIDNFFGEGKYKNTPKIDLSGSVKGKLKDKGKKNAKVVYNLGSDIFGFLGQLFNKLSETEDFTLKNQDKKQLDSYLGIMGGFEVSPLMGVFLVLIMAWLIPFILNGEKIFKNGKKVLNKIQGVINDKFRGRPEKEITKMGKTIENNSRSNDGNKPEQNSLVPSIAEES